MLAPFPKCLHTPFVVEYLFSGKVTVGEDMQRRFLCIEATIVLYLRH